MTLYQQIRAAGKEMIAKALRATEDLDFNAIRIAKRMRVPTAGRTLVFPDEAVQNAFFDFWVHEYRVGGKTLVESVDPVAAGLDPLEAEVLAAHLHTRTSFLLIEAQVPQGHQIRLRDLLTPDSPDVWLTDEGLSETLRRFRVQMAMFCRLVEVRGLTMTTGFSFVFKEARVPGILQAYRQKMKKVPPGELPEARFVFFLQKHRQLGEEMIFRDVG